SAGAARTAPADVNPHIPMNDIDIDALYEAFCERLPREARTVASELGFRLKLVPNTGIPWSEVFKHTVTVKAPWLCADSMPGVSKASMERAVFAHMLAVIEAFGTDRIADEQAPDTPELREVLARMRDARDQALELLGGPACARMGKE